MSLIMELIEPELSLLSALELKNLPYLTVYTIASANIDQSEPNLATIYCETRIFRRPLIFVDFMDNTIHLIKFTTNVWPGSLICELSTSPIQC